MDNKEVFQKFFDNVNDIIQDLSINVYAFREYAHMLCIKHFGCFDQWLENAIYDLLNNARGYHFAVKDFFMQVDKFSVRRQKQINRKKQKSDLTERSDN